MYKRIGVIAFSVVLFCAGMGGCASGQKLRIPTPQLTSQAQKAYDFGLAAMFRENTVDVDVIWAMKEILTLSPNEKIKQFVNEKTTLITTHSSLRLINPAAPSNTLPENPGTGIKRYSVYLKAPFGEPRQRAVSFISDFTETEESGYILTHQFFVLVWAEEMGLNLPQNVRDRKKDILDRILKEQQKAESFSDLYAERAAIVLYWANPEPEDAARWIDKIISVQKEDGTWPVYPFILFYDGQSAVIEPPVSHTDVLALLALRAYLNRY